MDRFDSLNIFVRVVDTGSISQAAEQLQVNKSVVSRRLAELEKYLGVQLLRRTTRKINLTEGGKAFYQRALRILEDLAEAETAVGDAHGAIMGSLNIAAPLSFGLMHLAPALTDFMQMHPKVNIRVDFNDRAHDLIQDGFDLAIRIGELKDSTDIARRLCPIRSVVVASPSYIKQNGTPKHPDELSRHVCFLYTNVTNPQTWQYQTPAGETQSVRIPLRHQANNGDFIRQAIVAGFGIAIMPSFIAWQSIEAGELVPILDEYKWREVNAYAVYPQTRHLSQRVQRFIEFLQERFAGVPVWDRCLQKLE